MRSFAGSLSIGLFASHLAAQTYSPPASGDYGGNGSYTVAVKTFTNPIYPTANGSTLTVSVYHPKTTIDPMLPTIFFAHGYTSPIGSAADYDALLSNLASRGYNVVFSPYEGGNDTNVPLRFDELTTGFDAAVANYGLNTARVGFAGHSYGGGLLPAIIQHEMMGLADQYRAGHRWGATAAFMFGMAPAYALGGGGDTGLSQTQAITFPANLNVVEQVYFDDKTIADPRLAIDVFYNITTPNAQKDFLTVYGDDHGTPAQVANHLLPNSFKGQTSTSLQAWAIFRHLDALAAFTFTGDATAEQLAVGHGLPVEINEGEWSDGVAVTPMGAIDRPAGSLYAAGPYFVQWNDTSNPRGSFPLVTGAAFFTGEVPLSNNVKYLAFDGGDFFGYYAFLSDPNYIYHFDLGYEYVFDADDMKLGVYFYDFASGDFWYSSPGFPFPYLYDFKLGAVLYYFPDTAHPGHYTTNPRYFYNFATGKIITR